MSIFSFVNQSCYRRQEEIARIKRFFFLNGYSESMEPAHSDVVLLFTCSFNQSRVNEMLDHIKRLRADAVGESELIVGSCLPKTDKMALEAVFTGKTITPTDFSALNLLPGITVKIEEVPEFANEASEYAKQQGITTTESAMPPVPLVGVATRLPGDKRMGVFVASGCVRQCTYCAIRFATGALRSKPLDVIDQIIRNGWERGFRRFEIYADSIGDYGLDISTNFGKLMESILKNELQFTVGIYDLHPQAFLKYFDAVDALCAAGKVHYLYVPIQSGSARVLQRMRRPCDTAMLTARLEQIRKHGSVFLQTGVMVGFPGETESNFDETLGMLSAIQFHDVFVHFYTDMPNTESSEMADKINTGAMRSRLNRLENSGIAFSVDKTRREFDAMPIL